MKPIPLPADPESIRAILIKRANLFLTTLSAPVVLRGPPESRAIQRAGVVLESDSNIVGSLDDSGTHAWMTPGEPGLGSARIYEGTRYREFPNSSLLHTVDPVTGMPRSFLVSRGVRDYKTSVLLSTGGISPQGYVSDVLIFEIVDGRSVYRSRILSSNVDSKFFFEDPRISVLHFKDGSSKLFLSGTDYSPHLPGSDDPDVMNRYVELELDARGAPLPVKTDARGRPSFSDLSPYPRALPDGKGVLSIDAKNATIAFNEENQVVVRTRLRPDFGSAEIQAMAGADRWRYGEQVFVFRDYQEFARYDWKHCLEDLFAAKGNASGDRVRPLVARVLVRDSEVKELYLDSRVLPQSGKGVGPGTPPVRVSRRGDQVWVSDGKNAREFLAGTAPRGFPIRDGEVTYLTFDHEIRYFNDVREGASFLKRHYSLAVKRFDPSLTRIQAYFADAIQPREKHELGYNSGIGDLQHVYPMGREVFVNSAGQARVRVSLGVSDAHTELVEVDPIALLMEMAPGSARWRTGQVYLPKQP